MSWIPVAVDLGLDIAEVVIPTVVKRMGNGNGNRNNRGPNQNRGSGPAAKGQNRERMMWCAVLLAWGFIPPIRASLDTLKDVVKQCLLQVAIKTGNWEFDPELPDDPITILLPALISRGVPKADVANVLKACMSATDVLSIVNSNGDVMTVMDAASSGDTWSENTAEWWADTWSGDWASGWTNFCQGWNDFWAGNY